MIIGAGASGEAAEVRAHGADYPWPKASDRRGHMINREHRDVPDGSGHVVAAYQCGPHRRHTRPDDARACRTTSRVLGGLFGTAALKLR